MSFGSGADAQGQRTCSALILLANGSDGRSGESLTSQWSIAEGRVLWGWGNEIVVLVSARVGGVRVESQSLCVEIGRVT